MGTAAAGTGEGLGVGTRVTGGSREERDSTRNALSQSRGGEVLVTCRIVTECYALSYAINTAVSITMVTCR